MGVLQSRNYDHPLLRISDRPVLAVECQPARMGGEVRGRTLEVFPHATAYVLGGEPEPARGKHAHRRRLLAQAGINTSSLRTADEVDAAVGAYTGWLALHGEFRAIGDPAEGVVVIPALQHPHPDPPP